MKTQNYHNHMRYYAPHHFFFYPILIVMMVISIRHLLQQPANVWEWGMICALCVTLTWLAFMTRQHYALTLQNRIVRLEFRFRYYTLTGQRLEPLEEQLSFGQLAALRFASDAELPALIQRTLAEKLTPGQVKQAIQHWLPDHMRV